VKDRNHESKEDVWNEINNRLSLAKLVIEKHKELFFHEYSDWCNNYIWAQTDFAEFSKKNGLSFQI
jgi:hypothetical protein